MVDSPLWFKNAVFYQVYIRAYRDSNADGHGDVRGLIEKLDYIKELGIDCIWLMPYYLSPLKDDGYDIQDYYSLLPEYGNLEDLREMISSAHARGMRVIADLVMNHTSDQHQWFQAARADRNSPFRDYYVWSDTDQRYLETRIIFVDTETSNWTWDELAGQYFWHRFYSSQPDLNYDNPAVQEEMLKVMRHWMALGLDGFRADAVPYLFERDGTNNESLPETHAFLKRSRAEMDRVHPGSILLCEANQPLPDMVPYFGEGDEFHLAFNFPLMPRLFLAFHRQDKSPVEWVMAQLPQVPENCSWCNFLRNHDDLTLEMVTSEERRELQQAYAPDPRMLINQSIRRRLAPLLENDQRRIMLANSFIFTLPGTPIVYYGDEIGMGDNIYLKDRDGVRTPMQWNAGKNGGFSEADAEKLYSPVIASDEYKPEKVNVAAQQHDSHSLLNQMRRMIGARRAHAVFGDGDLSWVEAGDKALAVYWRKNKEEQILVVNNLAGEDRTAWMSLAEACGARLVDLMSGETFAVGVDGKLEMRLKAYEYRWLACSR